MDPRFQVRDTERTGGCEELADVPLVTVAWRLLRSECVRRGIEQGARAGELDALRAALAGAAEEAFRLGRGKDARPGAASRIEQALCVAGVTILAPEGEPYTPGLMDLIENVAQVHDGETAEAYVHEVVAPAVLCAGKLLRMGKAVIAVPRQPHKEQAHDVADRAGAGDQEQDTE